MLSILLKIVNSTKVRLISGFLIAVLGIYGTFFYERKPNLEFEIVSSSGVLDIRESLSKLAIIYDGTDLKQSNKNLHLLVLRVSNSGGADILKSHFDDSAPLGFTISAGKILETPIIVADEYLKKNLRASILDERSVIFSPVILNAGESFQVRTLLLVDQYRSAIGRRLSLKEEYLCNQFIEQTEVFSAFSSILRPELRDTLEYKIVIEDPDHPGKKKIHEIPSDFEDEFNELESNGLIVRDGPQISVAQDCEALAREFLNFVMPVTTTSPGKPEAA